MRVDRYNSVEEYTRMASSKGAGVYSSSFGREHKWDDGVSFQQASKYAIEGNKSMASKHSEMLENLIANYQLREEPKKRYVASIVGSRVSVPDYLANAPRC